MNSYKTEDNILDYMNHELKEGDISYKWYLLFI